MTDETTRAANESAQQAAARLQTLTAVDRHDVAVILGSGWVPAAELLGETTSEFPVTDLPGFAPPAVEGHALIAGLLILYA